MAGKTGPNTFASRMLHTRVDRRQLLLRAAVLGAAAPTLAGLLAACEEAVDDEDVEAVDDDDDEVDPTDDDVETDDDDDEVDPTDDDDVTAELGAHLYGELEGPIVIRDSAQFPESLSEAPMLADLVDAGELPPLEERLPVPEDLLVIEPLHEIGTYGGEIRRVFTGPGDHPGISRFIGVDKLLFVDYTGTEKDPCIAKDWEISDDGTEYTLYLREGLNWSDGHPFTADDIVFWWEDIQNEPELVPIPTTNMQVGGEYGDVVKIDDYTVVFEFPHPNFLFEDIITTAGDVGHGISRGFLFSSYAPKHYLQQFHPRYVSEDELESMIQEEGFDTWTGLFEFKIDWTVNAEMPMMTPWVTVAGSEANTPTWILERNPYYWGVDTEGNQLPYADRVVNALAEDLEVATLRAAAGEYDFGDRHLTLANVPVLLREQENGNYTVRLDRNDGGGDCVLQFNQSYHLNDPELGELFHNRDFRRALSLGFDREELNQIFWLGLGTPGNWVVSDEHPLHPGEEYHQMWHYHDPDEANRMLDEIGLDERDNDGYRLRPDGERISLDLSTVDATFVDFAGVCEMIVEDWQDIGIDARVEILERSLFTTRLEANELMIRVWDLVGIDNVLQGPGNLVPTGIGNGLGPEIGRWFASGGEEGIEPTWDEDMLEVFDLIRSLPGLTEEERIEVGKQMFRIGAENVWTIGTVGWSSAIRAVRAVSNDLANVPERLSMRWPAWTPSAAHPSTFFFRD